MQELKHLAATSKTGKVTIVAHSNGGLVAKRLIALLGQDASMLIDKIIFVAVPQAGTPVAIAAALHGYGQDIANGLIVDKATARRFANTSPAVYNLLPSARYFTQVDDPVISFDASLPDWIFRYGANIHSEESLHTFLTDTYERVVPQASDIDQPTKASDALFSNAEAVHADLDAWEPPAGVSLIQIAGWGIPTTVSGITYKKREAGVTPEFHFVTDGDGTVVVPSALWTSATTSVMNYWMDLKKYSNDHWLSTLGGANGLSSFNHSNILETDSILNFITDHITNTGRPLSDYRYLSTQPPAANGLRLRYALHSPLTLNLYDDQGRHTGISTTTGRIETQIPGTYYTEFGDVKYLFSDASSPAHLVLTSYASGFFTLDIDQYAGDMPTAHRAFKDIPTATTTVVTMSVTSGLTTLSPMTIDADGDGTTDMTLSPKLGDSVIFDITPPTIQTTFSTTTQTLAFTSFDAGGSTTMTRSTAYSPLKKGKQGASVATTTLIARDSSHNTTTLVYTEPYPPRSSSAVLTLYSLAHNGSTTMLATTALAYEWRLHKSESYQSFTSSLQAATSTLNSTYAPKSDTTSITANQVTSTLRGMVVPYMTLSPGGVVINY